MKCKKNGFYYFCVSISVIGLLFIFVSSISTLGEAQEYPYIPKGLLMMGMLVGWILVQFVSKLYARCGISERVSVKKKHMIWMEAAVVLLILAGAFIVRMLVIRYFEIEPTSDYKTYYEIADLLNRGTIQKEGKGYCEYIAMFPHVIGYCTILRIAFAIWGTSTAVGLNVNLFFSVLAVLLTYLIARKCAGRIAGLVAITLCAFWPSQVLYSSILSAEPSFTALILLCALLFVHTVLDFDKDKGNPAVCFVENILLGVLLALTGAVRPMAAILLIAIIICLLPQRMELPDKPDNDIPLMLRFISYGWVRCILIVLPYMIVSGIITTDIELTIDKDVASGSTSFGYNMLVGLNTESAGGWNEEDKDLLYNTMEATGSSSQAHLACRDLAFQRLVSNPNGNLNLFVQKYELLWGNDDYGTTWNLAFLNEQGNLTDEKEDFLYNMRDINNIVYAVTVFFGIMGLLYLYKGKGNYLYVFILLYLGTVAMHLLVESQNRYHYFVLQVFMLLAGFGVQQIFRDASKEFQKKHKQQLLEEEREKERQETLQMYKEREQVLRELRAEALSNVFDMNSALKDGNIIMTVSEAYREDDTVEPALPRPEKAKTKAISKAALEEITVSEIPESPETPSDTMTGEALSQEYAKKLTQEIEQLQHEIRHFEELDKRKNNRK